MDGLDSTPAEPRAPDISIITVSFNTRDLVLSCIEAVHENSGGLSYDYLLVDNASSDGSVESVTARFPDVKVAANPINVGYGRGHNQVLSQCAGRYVVTINSDVVVHTGTLPALVDFMDGHPDAAVAGCRLVNEDGTHQRSAFHIPLVWPAIRRRILSALGIQLSEDISKAISPVDVGWLSGAVCIYRRQALEQVGFFDPQFFLYCEETDLHLRLSRAGWRIVYVPSITATHLWGRSADKSFGLALFHGEYSRLLFARKHSPLVLYPMTKTTTAFRALYLSHISSDRRLRERFWGHDPEVARRVYRQLIHAPDLRPSRRARH